MGVPENRLKRRLREDGAPALGVWVMSASPLCAEALGWAGFDFLVVDMEHSPLDLGPAIALMQAVQGTGCEVILRVPWNEPVMVKRVLDGGARTLMFPMVGTIAEAAAAVAATRYPPRGIRGVAAMHRGNRFGTVPGYLEGADAEIGVILQLETLEAVRQRAEIAAIDGVDALFVGPADLAASMGHLGRMDAPEVEAVLRETAGWCRSQRIPCGIIGADAAAVRGYEAMGFSYVAVGSDLGMMMAGARTALRELRGERVPKAPGSGY
jgi:2-keto-3-deoxy-L-rhamnonate aldolase RhmA